MEFEVISGKLEGAKKVVVYGPEGIGKSSLAANFPKPIFIDPEGSTTELIVDRLPKPKSWTMILEQIDWAQRQFLAGRFLTLVIDTVDWAEMQCVDHVCSTHGKKGVEDFGYGNGYIYAKEEFGRFLNKLSEVVDTGMHVVLLAHSQIRKFEQPDEMGSYDRYELKLGKKTSSHTAPLVKEWADMVLFLNYKTYSVAADKEGKKHKAQGGTRMMFTTHHPAWDAKNRQGLPDELPLDYAHIAHIFAATAPQVNQTWTSQPTHEQQQWQQPQNQAPPYQQPVPQEQQPAPPYQPPAQEQHAPQPYQAPSVQNEAPQQQAPQSQPGEHIPPALRELMLQSNVSEREIQAVVGKRGYYPVDTPMSNYDPQFINGVLIGAWQQVHGMVLELREAGLPF